MKKLIAFLSIFPVLAMAQPPPIQYFPLEVNQSTRQVDPTGAVKFASTDLQPTSPIFTTDIRPVSDGTTDIGTSSLGWRNVYLWAGASPTPGPAGPSGAIKIANATVFYTTQSNSNMWVGATVGNPAGTGGFNAAIGNNALNSNGAGTDNVAIGFHVLDHNTSGSYNLGLGSSALTTNVSGTGNTAYGRQALLQNNTGNFNIGIGYQCAFHLNTTGDGNNIVIGAGTAPDLITGIRNTIIGSGINGFASTISDSVLIGSAGNTRIYVNSAGDMGVGVIPAATPTPTVGVAAKLHIVKTAEQLRVGFDGSNYYSTTVSSQGTVTYDAFGSVPAGSPTPMPLFEFNDPVAIKSIPAGSPTPSPIPTYGILYVADGNLTYISPSGGATPSHTTVIANQ